MTLHVEGASLAFRGIIRKEDAETGSFPLQSEGKLDGMGELTAKFLPRDLQMDGASHIDGFDRRLAGWDTPLRASNRRGPAEDGTV